MSEPEEITEAEVVEETPGQEVEVRPTAETGLFGSNDPAEIVRKAGEVAEALTGVLEAGGMVSSIKGKKHVNIEGWQTLGTMLGVVPVVVWTREVEGGWEARAEARRAKDGAVVGAADAMCVSAEGGNWGPKQTSNGRRAMAQTRAMSRALRGPLGFVVHMAGYSAAAAEEIPAEQPEAASLPVWALPASDGRQEEWAQALAPLIGPAEAVRLMQQLVEAWGVLPDGAVAIAKAIAGAVTARSAA